MEIMMFDSSDDGTEETDLINSNSDNEFEDELRSKNEDGFLKDMKCELDLDDNHLGAIKIENDLELCQTFPWQEDPPDQYQEQVNEETGKLENPRINDIEAKTVQKFDIVKCFDFQGNDKDSREDSDKEVSEQNGPPLSPYTIEFFDENFESKTLNRKEVYIDQQSPQVENIAKEISDNKPNKLGNLFCKEELLNEKPPVDLPPCKVHYVDRQTSKCKVCGNIIINKAHLEEGDYDLREKTFVCEICGDYVLESLLTKHQELHPHTYFRCGLCVEKFSKIDDLFKHYTVHKQFVNPEDHIFQCGHCYRKYPDKYKLRRHIVRLHRTPSMACEFCPKMYCTSYGLNRHITTSHSNVLQYK